MRETLVKVKVVRCLCGDLVELWDSFENKCDGCGQRYNGVGQKLRTYCCELDENGVDCMHGETE